tara:strand:+ start:799 stop:1752 length:954 start_codon:yes stop_codon:yes gene_type:complete
MKSFIPFSQSLVNQGMNQTNRLAANATNPPNLGNPPYTTFNNNNINPGGGNVMGGSGFGPGSDMLGVGQWAPGAGTGGNIGPGDVWGEGTQGHMGFGGSLGGDAYDDYIDSGDFTADDLMDQGVFTLPDGSGYVISNMQNIYGSEILEQAGMGTGQVIFDDPESALATIQYLQSLLQLQEQGFNTSSYLGDPIEGSEQSLTEGFDFGSGFGSGLGGLNFGLGFGFGFGTGNYNYGIPGLGETTTPFGGATSGVGYDEFQQILIDAQQQAPTFAGGGGQGGQAAKRLYYPGTSGGFASVGSGIGGNDNMLQNLLKGLG